MPGTVYTGVGKWQGSGPDVVTHGFFRLRPGDRDWQPLAAGLPADPEVRAIALHPEDARIVFAGTQAGIYCSDDGGDSWFSLDLPGALQTVWSIAFDPRNPATLFVGVEGFAVWRSRDGGANWTKLDVPTPGGVAEMPFPTRVVRIVVDPSDPDTVYAGLEVHGVVRSRDGGDTWDDISGDLIALARANDHLQSGLVTGDPVEGMMDTHALTVSPSWPGSVWLANRMGLFASADRGDRWAELGIGRFSPLTYARDVQVSPHDPQRFYAALSIAAVSDAGSLWRSDDGTQTWRRFDADLPINSTLMIIAQSASDPDTVWCGARAGQVFGTEDGGASWRDLPLPAGTSGIYAMACA